ncbi:MAG: hypothetical protein ABIJ57_17285 [Pseudomonadota bacterium]
MRKLILCVLLITILAAAPAHAKTYTLTTGVTATPVAVVTTGATTAANGGVSPFALNGDVASYDLYPQLDRHYAYGFQLTGVSPSQAVKAAGTDWSGVTITVFGKFKSDSDDVPWAAVEPVYFLKDKAVNSGDSPYTVWINAPPADRGRVYFETSGPIAIDVAQAKLIASEIPLNVSDTVVLIPASPASYVVNASSGVSSMTVPAGASKTYVRVAGSDIRYTLDGTTPDANSSMILSQGQTLEIDGRGLAQAFKFRETSGGTGSTVWPTHTNERE